MNEPGTVGAFRAEDDVPIPGFDANRMALYERATAERGPRELLVMALERFMTSLGTDSGSGVAQHAFDLGCGLGQETELLLRRGWQVTASDASARMLECTLARARAVSAENRLRLIHAPFDRTELARSSVNLVHAGFALPFCTAEHFPGLWGRMLGAIRPGGFFVGQLFGPDDEFVRHVPSGSMSAHSTEDLPELFRGFVLLHHEEVNRVGETAPGKAKHWHVHHLIARRSDDA